MAADLAIWSPAEQQYWRITRSCWECGKYAELVKTVVL
jgi:hypothetical protein